MRLLLAVWSTFGVVFALNNGMGRTPAMGYSSWNDCASEVTEERIKNVTRHLIESGLAAKGFVHINVDEGWLLGRDNATGEIVEDRKKFPNGMKALGEWIHAQEVPGQGKVMKYGLYTSRGTCQCSTNLYHAPGSHGFEVQDAQWLVRAGADYLKEDSCCGDQDHSTAFGDYAKMRDALNATGRPVYFSLCGWNSWYAPKGDSLGNSWRIAGDGRNWGALSNCINTNAPLGQYARPGAWNDPDLLMSTGKGSNDLAQNPSGCFDAAKIPQADNWYQTELQSRAQMSAWAVMSGPLLISADVGQVSAFQLETWGNEEVIAVDQQFQEGGPYQGERIVGGDLSYDKDSNTGNGTNVWVKPLPKGSFALLFISNEDRETDVTCDAACFEKVKQILKPGAADSYVARDLWAKTDIGTIKPPLSFTAKGLPPHGGVQLLRFTPSS